MVCVSRFFVFTNRFHTLTVFKLVFRGGFKLGFGFLEDGFGACLGQV